MCFVMPTFEELLCLKIITFKKITFKNPEHIFFYEKNTKFYVKKQRIPFSFLLLFFIISIKL